MLGAFIAFLIKTEWGLKLVIGAFLLAMFKMGQEGFVGAVTGGMVWENQGIPRLHGSTPLYRHPNSYSGMAVGCLPFIFYLYPICSKWKKIFLILLFVFSITIIVYTGSRTGYIATVLIFIYLWRERLKMSRVKYLVLGIGASLVAVYLLPDAYMGRFISIFTLEEAEGASANARIRIIEDAVSVFLAKPWGVGVAAFPAVRMEMFGEYQDTHNLYLELLTNLSFFGLLGFLYLIYKILKTNFYIRESSSSKFIVAISNSIIAFVYARLFLGLFGMDTYEIYWWFAVGVTVSMYRIVHEKDKVSVLSLGNQ
jgi:O-antigen ligase